MAVIRFRSAKTMFAFVAVVVLGGGGLIVWRLGKGTRPTDGNSLYWEAQKLEALCHREIDEAAFAVGPLSQLEETEQQPREVVPSHRPRFDLPPSLSAGPACSTGLKLAEMENAGPAALEMANARIAALRTPGRVLLATSGECTSECDATLVWLDVANKKVLGVKKLRTSTVTRARDLAAWAASR